MPYCFSFFKEICRIVSWKKIHNLLKLTITYHFKFLPQRFRFYHHTFSIAIEPTNNCQLRCKECPTGMGTSTRPKGFLQFEDFQKAIDQCADYLLNLTFYFQGEPFLHKDACRCIAYAKEKKIFVNTSTNGQNIDEDLARQIVTSGLHRLVISLDGKDQNSYEQYRQNGSIDKVFLSIRNVAAAKRKARSPFPQLVVQCLLLRSTENDIAQIIHLAKQAGADKVVFKTAQFYDLENRNELLPINNANSRYQRNQDGKYECKTSPKIHRNCWRAWTSVVITWDMNVLPCCFDKDGLYCFGNLKQNNLWDILHGEKYLSFQHASKNMPMCHNCIQ